MTIFSTDELAQWSNGLWTSMPSHPIHGICHDTRNLKRSDMFVAIRGDRFDGHDFLPEAFAKGASAALVDKHHSKKDDKALLRVNNTREALVTLAAGHRARLNGLIIGITGSVGKTTVKELTAKMLSQKATTAQTPGNWNNDIGLPLSLLKMSNSDAYGVYEIGMNHPGELQPLCELLQPSWGLITTIGPVHLEAFNSVKEIAYEKGALFRSLPDNGQAFLFSDEEWCDFLIDNSSCHYIRIAMDTQADFSGTLIRNQTGTYLECTEPDHKKHIYALPQPGTHFARNVLMAIASARTANVTTSAIEIALETYRTPPMRWQTAIINNVVFINDAYNANPLSMHAALKTFAECEYGKHYWLMLGGMHELGNQAEIEHKNVGRIAACGSWCGIFTIGKMGAWIADGALEAGWPHTKTYVCNNLDEALLFALDLWRGNDAVLLKASRSEHLEEFLHLWKSSAEQANRHSNNSKSK